MRYRRATLAGATYFFTVNLADRRADHLTRVAGGQFPRQFGDEKRVVLQQDQRRGYLKIVLHADHRALWC